MPELKWDETDFLDCLEVFPEKDEEFYLSYVYEVRKHGMALTVVVWPWESFVLLSLRQQEMKAPLFEVTLAVRERVRYVKDKRGDYLEFQDCIILPKISSYYSGNDVFDRSRFSYGVTLQLTIKPHIQIRYVQE